MKVFIICAFIALAAAAPQYPKPEYQPAYKADTKYEYHPYQFAWAVKDDYTYNDYAHEQVADDKGYVKGSYRVALPDGRIQTVTYTADAYNGYNADVVYAGEAKYPEYKPAYKAPAYPTYEAPKY